jgi:hypothetical protein
VLTLLSTTKKTARILWADMPAMIRRKVNCWSGLIVMLLSCVCSGQKAASTEDWSDALVKWDTQCGPKGCLLMTDVLRGYSGDPVPPDSKDTREYIGIYVAVDRTTRKPAYFAFHVDPNSQQEQGVFVAFTKTTKDGDKLKMGLDKDGASRLPFSSCGQDSCVARIPDGLVGEGKERHRMDLLEKFLNADSVLILYVKNGKAYRTMILLSSFKKAYAKVLSSELDSTQP